MNRILDLFCGAVGGWSHGLHAAGFETVAACEIDPWRRSVFQRQFPKAVMYADVRELTADRLRADLGYLPDVVVGSPPCQEISAANSKGDGITDDHLFWDWCRLVFEIRPIWCAAENSPRARTSGIDGILDALALADYAAWPAVVGAEHAGANHRRSRLWLVAADANRSVGEAGRPSWRQAGEGRGGERLRESFPSAAQSNRHHAYAGGCGDARHTEIVEGVRLGGVLERGGPEPARARLPADGHTNKFRQQMRHQDDAAIPGGDGKEKRLPYGTTRPADAGVASHANDAPRRQPSLPNRPAEDYRPPADPDGTRHAIGPRQPGDDGPELPAALREIGLAWPDWNGGLAGLTEACAAAGFGHMDDGAKLGLPAGLRNRAIAALGDSVVRQIAEAIGRAMIVTVGGAL